MNFRQNDPDLSSVGLAQHDVGSYTLYVIVSFTGTSRLGFLKADSQNANLNNSTNFLFNSALL